MIECDDFDLSNGFYLVFMHSLSIVAVPLNMLGIYCILYKSTMQMGAYKCATIINLFLYRCHEYSCAKSAFSVPNLQIFIPHKLRQIVITIALLCCLAFLISVICITVSFKFLRENGSMSQRTKQMQKRFLVQLSIQ
ncbi:hypothetical protein OSTOST_05434, partial [Ostertagia ostertagi]